MVTSGRALTIHEQASVLWQTSVGAWVQHALPAVDMECLCRLALAQKGIVCLFALIKKLNTRRIFRRFCDILKSICYPNFTQRLLFWEVNLVTLLRREFQLLGSLFCPRASSELPCLRDICGIAYRRSEYHSRAQSSASFCQDSRFFGRFGRVLFLACFYASGICILFQL